MPRSDPDRRAFDWRGWLALAWAAWFGLLYGGMILERRAPRAMASIRGARAAASRRSGGGIPDGRWR